MYQFALRMISQLVVLIQTVRHPDLSPCRRHYASSSAIGNFIMNEDRSDHDRGDDETQWDMRVLFGSWNPLSTPSISQ